MSRVEIYALLKADLSQTKIAEIVSVSKSIISRELERNTGLKGCRPKQANERTLERRKNADKHIRFNNELKENVAKLLEQDWSPEQISGWLKHNNIASLSHETIYQFVIAHQQTGGDLYKHLGLGQRKRLERLEARGRWSLSKKTFNTRATSRSLTTSGSLTEDERWSGSISCTNDVTVPAGVTLIIDPDATVTFPASKKLRIYGTLVAEGSELSDIEFDCSIDFSPQLSPSRAFKLPLKIPQHFVPPK